MEPARRQRPGEPRGLAAWGEDLKGEWRLILYAGLGGAAFSLLVWFTAVYALTGRPGSALGDGRSFILPGVLVFSTLWALFGTFAVLGWPRVFLCTLMAHLIGYLVMTANLLVARLSGYDALQAGVTLFGITLLGFVVGVALEAALAARHHLGHA